MGTEQETGVYLTEVGAVADADGDRLTVGLSRADHLGPATVYLDAGSSGMVAVYLDEEVVRKLAGVLNEAADRLAEAKRGKRGG